MIRRLTIALVATARVAVAATTAHAGAFYIVLHQPVVVQDSAAEAPAPRKGRRTAPTPLEIAPGAKVYVNAEQIDYIGPPAPGESSKHAKARLMVYGIWVWVFESPDEIKAAIDKVLKQDQ